MRGSILDANVNITQRVKNEKAKEEIIHRVSHDHDAKNVNSVGRNERSLAINSSDQIEIRQNIDQYLETQPDGSHKCTICGKIDPKRASGKSLMRCHIETHIEGLAYQCPLCDKTFRSVNVMRTHKSRFHK